MRKTRTAANPVRQQAPEQPSRAVTQRTDGDQGRAVRRQLFRLDGRIGQSPDILKQRRLETDHGNPGGDVEEEDEPHDRELARAQALGNGSRILVFLQDRRDTGGRYPIAGRRIAQEIAGRQQDQGEQNAEPGKNQRQVALGMDDQNRRQNDAQQERADAEPHDDDAGRQPLAVGVPFRRRRHRGYIAEPDPRAADHAIAEIKRAAGNRCAEPGRRGDSRRQTSRCR